MDDEMSKDDERDVGGSCLWRQKEDQRYNIGHDEKRV